MPTGANFKVNVRGDRFFYFDTLEAAKAYCEKVWQLRGTILSIEAA